MSHDHPEPHDEPAGLGRRDFLRAAGYAVAGAALAGCAQRPPEKAVPYLTQPEGAISGRPLSYVSTCTACPAACGLLMTCRDGRPVKLEGDPQHPLNRGGLCAVGQASILGVCDSHRYRAPRLAGQDAAWSQVDATVTADLAALRGGGAVRLLTGSVLSPTLRAAMTEFLAGFADARHVIYDPLSQSAIADAHALTHGVRATPTYRFERADVIVSFDADFLGTWLSPVEHAADWRTRRVPGPTMSHHTQFEPRLSITGTKADRRVALPPGQLGAVLTQLTGLVAALAGQPLGWERITSPVPAAALQALAGRLWAARGRALVVCGVQDVPTQVLCNYLNELLGSYGNTVDLQRWSNQRQGNDAELAALLAEIRGGGVRALLIHGVNPVAELPGGAELAAALRKIPLLVSFAGAPDETSEIARVVAPDHHPLETWGDAEPVNGLLSLQQPGIAPLYETRAVAETLSVWSGRPQPVYEQVRAHWMSAIFPRQTAAAGFESFWQGALQAGAVQVSPAPCPFGPFNATSVRPVGGQTSTRDLVLYPKVGIGDGRHAGNPWLQELPDPITKVTWDNYACLSPAAAKALGVSMGDHVTVAGLTLPVVVQKGQPDGVVAVALGYGRQATKRFADLGPQWLEAQPCTGPNGLVGVNASDLLELRDGLLRYHRTGVMVARAEGHTELAITQTYDSTDVPEELAPEEGKRRPMIEQTTLAAFLRDPHAGAPGEHAAEGGDIWPEDHPYRGHHWSLTVDLNACTGCGACVVACSLENNVPVVGRDEVRRRRELHWLRIDRYYTERDDGALDTAQQPMLCHHCDNAPCEVVCPVLATVHSEEGLNQQVYNRCVGTRYCANNCPYKVRRFNWFNYPHDDETENLLLNPDVTVRTRGVMEKCTFCVQRIERAKVDAREAGRPLADGDVQPACMQTCPARAIVFGDRNDPASAVARAARDPRTYQLLTELNVKPSVGYQRIVRNRAEGTEEQHG